MAKKNKRNAVGDKKFTSSPPVEFIPAEKLSARGKKVIAAGIGVLVVGFWLLTYTDPAGQNWASVLSPFLLIAGYVVIGIGIVLPDPRSSSPALPDPH